MYIRRVSLQNVCSFENLTLEFNPPKDSRYWALLLGDNGAGKTTVLRSIAMGLCSWTSAGALLRELYGEWVHYQATNDTATIRIELSSPNKPDPVSITTTIIRSPTGDAEIHQETEPTGTAFPWKDIFVCGYGASRSSFNSTSADEYSSVDSVYSLFNYGAHLQDPEKVLRRNPDGVAQILKTVEEILIFPSSSLTLATTIVRKGEQGTDDPMAAWGDGHRTTAKWVLDLCGWASLFDKTKAAQDVSGIVLLDEIEHHLHPTLQRRIIGRLRKAFPNIQFITTTNSPLCAVGTTELADDECGLFLLKRDTDAVQFAGARKPPRGLRADQILTSYLFGLETTRSDDVVVDIERYSHLKGKKGLSSQEQNELTELHARLVQDLGSAETEMERQVEKAVRESIDKLARDSWSSQPPAPEAIDFEIRRQLRELFSIQPK